MIVPVSSELDEQVILTVVPVLVSHKPGIFCQDAASSWQTQGSLSLPLAIEVSVKNWVFIKASPGLM